MDLDLDHEHILDFLIVLFHFSDADFLDNHVLGNDAGGPIRILLGRISDEFAEIGIRPAVARARGGQGSVGDLLSSGVLMGDFHVHILGRSARKDHGVGQRPFRPGRFSTAAGLVAAVVAVIVVARVGVRIGFAARDGDGDQRCCEEDLFHLIVFKI